MEKGHGRLEKRVMTTSTQMREWFANEWSGIEQVFRLERTVTRKGQTSTEIAYGITSLASKRLLSNWLATFEGTGPKNRLHCRGDVTLQEDHSQIRTEHVPSLLALLNSTILALIDLRGVANVPARMRCFNTAPLLALPYLVGTL